MSCRIDFTSKNWLNASDEIWDSPSLRDESNTLSSFSTAVCKIHRHWLMEIDMLYRSAQALTWVYIVQSMYTVSHESTRQCNVSLQFMSPVCWRELSDDGHHHRRRGSPVEAASLVAVSRPAIWARGYRGAGWAGGSLPRAGTGSEQSWTRWSSAGPVAAAAGFWSENKRKERKRMLPVNLSTDFTSEMNSEKSS